MYLFAYTPLLRSVNPPRVFPMAPKNYDSLLVNWKCLLACVLVSMCPFQYGIDFGLIAGLQAMVGFLKVYGYRAPNLPSGYNISTERQQLIASLMTLGAVIASGFAGPIAWKLGRKATYGTYFFEMAGVGNAFQNSIILVAVAVFIMIVNACIIVRWGRRRVMLTSGLILCGLVHWKKSMKCSQLGFQLANSGVISASASPDMTPVPQTRTRKGCMSSRPSSVYRWT
ncbi:uncharacterized protein MYCFIDRAFT_194288 [Pseudocercospora fijiensis CIRAD86]|uniref:Major facilitator superfamily (MFS) profile domain-containing protein n=1 Tax=Pseudocercospora fijiensis (strain CIRAD86) TaxID=383855 RepID=M3BA63_PSEFD|nr:uncharacterized protein MYCFIDRAFT_194288 [Pseudocercospora fijiensis CIRAD86]EME86148.1 hypothetical protein MYCFIDRAFT_194288 [Pseudocercospora fijiensis CIRAD86]